MKIAEKLRKKIGINNPQKVAEGIAKTYTEKKENGEEHPIDSTVETIMKIIKENPDPQKVKEILKAVLEEEKIPNKVFEKTATKISKSNEIPDEIITTVVEKTDTQLPDELINNMIKEGEFGVQERFELIKNVEDEKIIKERVKNEFKVLYANSEEKTDIEVVNRVKDLKNLLGDINEDTEIENLINKIVAKKMAECYYDDKIRGTRIYTLAQIMPTEKMIETDLPSKVVQEYQKIEEEKGEKEDRINAKELKIQILDEMARTIAYKYKDANVFVIPQSDNMKKLDKEEEGKFIDAIQKYLSKEMTKKQRTEIKAQIRGNTIKTKENKLISEIRKIPKKYKNESMDILIRMIDNEETLKTISMLENSNFINELNSIPEEKRKVMIEKIKEVVVERNEKIAIKEEKVKNDPQQEECGEDR